MTYRKGQITNKHREAKYAYATDIPIPGAGLKQNLNLIHDAARTCEAGADTWSYSSHLADGKPQYWCRIGTMDAGDADRLASLFSHLEARRVR